MGGDGAQEQQVLHQGGGVAPSECLPWLGYEVELVDEEHKDDEGNV